MSKSLYVHLLHNVKTIYMLLSYHETGITLGKVTLAKPSTPPTMTIYEFMSY